MDAATTTAISAVHLADDSVAQRWFQHVCATYEVEQTDWSAFTTRLADEGPQAGVDSWLVEQFVEFMDNNDHAPMDTIGRMAESPTELPALYRQHAEATATEAATGEGATTADGAANADGAYDESAWQTFLPEHGNRWDGTDEAWDQFRTWFLYEAGQQGLANPATGFISYAESSGNKVAAFAAYGMTIGGSQAETAAAPQAETPTAAGGQDVESFPDVKPGDSGEWVTYLDTMLTHHGY